MLYRSVVQPSRREVIETGLVGLAYLLLPGCGNSLSGTGVRGLDTPSQILSNPHVSAIIDEVQNRGYSLHLSQEINPPVISGKYDFTGRHIYPGTESVAPGTWRWRNQTADNHIDTDYEQVFSGVEGGQSGVSSLGEIIRGSGSAFTVYSIQDIRTSIFGEIICEDRVVSIVDGNQDPRGDVEAIYLNAPIGDGCLVPTAGVLYLTLTGPAKIKENSTRQGYIRAVGRPLVELKRR